MPARKIRKLKQENAQLRTQVKELEEICGDREKTAREYRRRLSMIYGFVSALEDSGSHIQVSEEVTYADVSGGS